MKLKLDVPLYQPSVCALFEIGISKHGKKMRF